MSCQDSRLQILALLESDSEELEPRAVQAHLEACPACREFYQRETALNRLLQDPALELDPPEWLWTSIAARIGDAPIAGPSDSILDRLSAWLGAWIRQPAPGYGLATLALLILLSLGLFRLPTTPDRTLLAELDQYTLENAEPGNPFLAPEVSRDSRNPFLATAVDSGRGNPFAEFRRRP